MQKTDLKRSYIREQIRKLDHIFVPQSAQKQGVQKIYDMPEEQITILGMGYNKDVFHVMGKKPEDGITRLVFAGKIAEKKGVKSLIKSLSYLPYKREELEVLLAGSAGNETEFRQIQDLASKCPYPVRFLGRLSQPELAKVYNQSDVFVLPSFFDGLPLTVIEALACGDRVDVYKRQEFTQIDMELSFVDVDDVIDVNERLLAKLFKDVLDVEVPLPIPRMTWQEAMDRYGSDKPDTRFGMELTDVTEVVKDSEFVVFKGAIENGGTVRGINAKGQGEMPRKKIDKLVSFAKDYGAKGLAYICLLYTSLCSSPFFIEQEENKTRWKNGCF